MENLSLVQLQSFVCNAMSLGYFDAYFGKESKTKQEVLNFLTVENTSTEQAMLLNCAYGVGTLMGKNDK